MQVYRHKLYCYTLSVNLYLQVYRQNFKYRRSCHGVVASINTIKLVLIYIDLNFKIIIFIPILCALFAIRSETCIVVIRNFAA